MTRLLRLSSLRFFLLHPWEIALTVLGVAMGVGVVVSIDLAIQSSREAFRISTESVAGRSTHRIVGSGGGVPDGVFTALRVEKGLRESAPVTEGYVTSLSLPGRPLRVLGIDAFSEGAFRPFLLGGASGLDVTSLLSERDGFFLGADLAGELGLEEGDRLLVRSEGRDFSLQLAGILNPSDELSRRGIMDLLVVDVALGQELLGLDGRLTRIDLILPDYEIGRSMVSDLQAWLPDGARLLETGARSAGLSQMIRAFDLNLTALSLLALIFGMFLIYNTMTFSVVQRRGLFGSLRALGVTRRELLGLVLRESALLGLVGTFLGLALGIVLGRGLVGLVTQTINDLYFVLSVESLSVPPSALLKGAVLGLASTVLASFPPALEATLSPPRAALTRSVLEERAKKAVPRAAFLGAMLFAVGLFLLLLPSRSILLSFGGLFGIVMGLALLTPLTTAILMRFLAPVAGRAFGTLGVMATRGVVTAMSRTAPAMAALVVAVSVTVGLGIMITSFRDTVVQWLDGTLQADIYVSVPGLVSSRPQGTLDPVLVDRLTRAEGLAGYSTYREAVLETVEGEMRAVALDLFPEGESAFDFKEGGGAGGFREFRENGAVFLSETLAYRKGLSLGDTLVLPSDRGPLAARVAGVFFDYGSDQGVVMMSRGTYERSWSDRGITSLGFFVEDGSDVDVIVSNLQARAGDDQLVLVRSNRSLKAASLEVFDRTFAITGVLRLLAFVVAFIGVLSALMALQLERGRELGVLRANGLTPGQIWQLVTFQTGAMGLVAGILAVPAGLLLAAVMIFVVNKRSFGWTLQLEVGPDILIQAVLLAVVGALLAGIFPSWRMSRTSPALALREE
ncbi:MAG: FtsX-like permease family protein [Gemmatimonadetes bacterium]|nr:FtsX-like permease family protein [Gemmatimonadota bacterium]